MAVPTPPTANTIVTEAFKKAGYSNPTSVQTTRAKDYWMQEIKADIFRREKRLNSLYITAHAVTTIGVHRYANPTDYVSDLDITLLDGSHTGTLQTGSASSATLAAAEDVTSGFIIGKYILITSGTGKGSCSQCISYSESTKVAGVSPNFTTAPVAADGYRIIDTYYSGSNFRKISNTEMDSIIELTPTDLPYLWTETKNETSGEFIIYPVPDDVYGLRIRYFVNLKTLDLTGTLMATLYERWQDIWVQGIFYKALQDTDDDRYKTEFTLYDGLLQAMIKEEKSDEGYVNGFMENCY